MIFTVQVASENALIVYCQEHSLLHNNHAITTLTGIIEQSQISAVCELVPAYQSVLVIFDIDQTDHFQMKQAINACCLKAAKANHTTRKSTANLHSLPVCYAMPKDNDLQRIAEHNSITVDEVIHIHTNITYRVFSLGFAPGFAFMGETDPRIATPRLDSPRKQVPQGAVAIADRQTAIYPNRSPGGWNIVGMCPVPLFNANQHPACLFSVGDQVKFNAIDIAQFNALLAECSEHNR